MNTLRKELSKIKEFPIDLYSRELFVNRELEIVKLQNAVDIYQGQIIGIAGERGIGKTSLINIISFPGKEKLIVRIVDRENKISIIADIVQAIYEYASSKNKASLMEKSLKAFEELVSVNTKEASIGVSYVINASLKLSKKRVLKRSTELLKSLVEELDDVVFVLDEIDKERKEEILLIMDSIKDAFIANEATLLITLPYSIYEEYLLSKESEKETYNLENVFTEMLLLHPLTSTSIEELLLKRIDKKYLSQDALSLIVEYSRGNPRRAISLLKEAGMQALLKRKNKIEFEDVKESLIRYLLAYFSKIPLNSKEKEVLSLIEEKDRASIAKLIQKKLKTTLSSSYRKIELFERLNLIEIKEGKVRLTPILRIAKRIGFL